MLDARYVGQNFELAIGLGDAEPLPAPDEIKQRFFAEHERAYGFHNPADPIEIVNFRLIAVGKLRQPGARPGEARKSGKARARIASQGLVRGRCRPGHAGLRSRDACCRAIPSRARR